MVDISFITALIPSNGWGKLITIFIVLLVTVIFARIIRHVLDNFVTKKSRLIKVDPTRYAFLKHFVTAVIYIIGISVAIYMIPSLKSLSVSLFAGAGVLAIIIGFASQQAFSNIIGGIFISISKPFRLGDRLKIGTDVYGIVEDLTLRHTVIRTFENKRILIPNSIINSQKIENYDIGDHKICRFLNYSISYDSNIDKAIKIIQEEAMKHPDFLDNRDYEEKKQNHPPISVRVVGFGESSVNLKAYVWAIDQGVAFRMGCDLNKSIKERFDKEGIEIPFPYRTIVYKKDINKKE